MCKPFSCVVKSDLSVLAGQTVTTHSHSEILRQHGLPQEISIDQLAKVELVVDGNHPADPDKWKLVLDEDRKPSWWAENLPEIVDRVRQAAWKWLAKIKAKTEFCLDEGDFLHLPFGSPAVRMPGGKLRAFGDSAPVVRMSGGKLLACGQSAPVVTMTGGELWAYGQSAPVVEMSGGKLLACGQSAPVVTMTEGWLVARNRAAPVVTMTGGELVVWDASAPVVTMTGGELVARDASAPVVTMAGGELLACGQSAPVVTMAGGELLACGQSAPVANGVKMRPGQRATIVNGELVIT